MKNVSEHALIFPVLSREESQSILESAGELGRDDFSENFATRTKSIGFMIKTSGRWFQVHQDHFNQHSVYNDKAGGFKRYYKELPETFLQNKATARLLDTFQKVCNIPDGELVLLQVQESHIRPGYDSQCLTGQGIHSDGTNSGIVVCLERNNVMGARTAVFKDPEGERIILGPTVLEEGEVLFWDDNKTYHYVEPAVARDPTISASRTVIIGHYPAIYVVSGKDNPTNKLSLSGKHPRFAKYNKKEEDIAPAGKSAKF